jgi:hypothetical protein
MPFNYSLGVDLLPKRTMARVCSVSLLFSSPWARANTSLAFTIEARYLHLSRASMYSPNLGLNNVNGMPGISWFF